MIPICIGGLHLYEAGIMQRRRKEVWDGAKLQGSLGDGNSPEAEEFLK